MLNELPTIFALASPPGRGGVAVIRLSGPSVRQVLAAMIGRVPEPRLAVLRAFRNPQTCETIDRGIAIFFPGPASFTGEDMGELHAHGGRAVVKALLDALGGIAGCRMAEPGEFARRAFYNGKLDLTAAEGLADLIDASTEAQRRQALAQASGRLAQLYDSWRAALIEASALVEAAIDFSDEADVGSHSFEQARAIAATLKTKIRRHVEDGRRGEIIREGLRVVLAGAPNAGKSSLLNALAKRDAAIVSEEAGTTRDVIEVTLDIGGYPVVLLDTAGVREAEGAIEREGIRRTLERVREADVVAWVMDGAAPVSAPEAIQGGPAKFLPVVNKADLADGNTPRPSSEMLAVSAKTGQGLEALTGILGRIAEDLANRDEGPAITQVRHRQLIEASLDHLDDFLLGEGETIELRAEDLRLAASALGRITGRVDVEDVLGEIFARFCIGK